MDEHPLFEQGNPCPAIRLPFQEFEAMDETFRWPIAPSQGQPCLHSRFLFAQIAGKRLQFRLAPLFHVI